MLANAFKTFKTDETLLKKIYQLIYSLAWLTLRVLKTTSNRWKINDQLKENDLLLKKRLEEENIEEILTSPSLTKKSI